MAGCQPDQTVPRQCQQNHQLAHYFVFVSLAHPLSEHFRKPALENLKSLSKEYGNFASITQLFLYLSLNRSVQSYGHIQFKLVIAFACKQQWI